MSAHLEGIDQWREYFRTANGDIFEIIERGIMVAASDCPKEFKLRRDRIAEVLYSTGLTRCTQCDQVGLSVPEFGDSGRVGGGECDGPGGSKESKANSVRDDQIDVNLNPMSTFSYGDAEALTNEIEEEGLVLEEVFRIKRVLESFEDESDSVLYESLRKLQLMQLNITILKATEIGKTVNGIRRHGSKQIRLLARELIIEWKAVVDEYMQTTQEIKDPPGSEEATPDSVNPSVVDYEEGLPSPPMDDCAFFTTQNVDFSQFMKFFDGMDDDGNIRNSGEFNKNPETARNQVVASRKEQFPKEKAVLTKEHKVQQVAKQEPVPKLGNKPTMNPTSGPGRPIKPSCEQRVMPSQKLQKKSDKPAAPQRSDIQSEKMRASNEDSVQAKLEATKRRLQERYQEAEKAKRQRTIQVMDLHDLPKQGVGQRNSHNKFGNSARNWASGRR